MVALKLKLSIVNHHISRSQVINDSQPENMEIKDLGVFNIGLLINGCLI